MSLAIHIVDDTAKHATIVTRTNANDDGSYKWYCVCGVRGDELTYYRRASLDASRHRYDSKEHFFAKPLNPYYKQILSGERNEQPGQWIS